MAKDTNVIELPAAPVSALKRVVTNKNTKIAAAAAAVIVGVFGATVLARRVDVEVSVPDLPTD